jgi:hypothetical protein
MNAPAAPPPPRPPDAGAAEAESAATGLPWPRTWRGVYLLVLGSFVAWVGLLTLLTRWFS